MSLSIPVSALVWAPCHRLVASRFPTTGPYDTLASPGDLEVVLAVAALTDPQMRQELGRLSLVPPEARVSGPGATMIMTAFTHLNPLGSRFSDGLWGVYYAGDDLDTAVAEVSHHRAAFLARTQEPTIDLDLRWIQADLRDKLHDLRGRRADLPEVYDPVHYGASQTLARTLKEQGSAGIVYESVRRPSGQCVAVFRPKALSSARAAGHVGLRWDGRTITHWFDKGAPRAV